MLAKLKVMKVELISPMLLFRTEKLPDERGWHYEIKRDGYLACHQSQWPRPALFAKRRRFHTAVSEDCRSANRSAKKYRCRWRDCGPRCGGRRSFNTLRAWWLSGAIASMSQACGVGLRGRPKVYVRLISGMRGMGGIIEIENQ